MSTPRVAAAWVLAVAVLAGCSGGTNRAAGKVAPTRPAATSTTSTTAPPVTYTVKAGDTLGAIAKRFGASVDALVASNKLTDPNRLTEGQVLVIPPTTTTTTVAATTTTAPAPAKLVVTPGSGAVGTVFQLQLSGALPAETVTFEIDGPAGRKFTGSPHTPTPQGKVDTVYVTTAGDVAGDYTVIATGTLHTSARATFTVTATGTPVT